MATQTVNCDSFFFASHLIKCTLDYIQDEIRYITFTLLTQGTLMICMCYTIQKLSHKSHICMAESGHLCTIRSYKIYQL